MSESKLKERTNQTQYSDQLAATMRTALKNASSLENKSDYNGASAEYQKASDAALKLSDHYDSGPFGAGAAGHFLILNKGYKNMAGVYAGRARNAKGMAELQRI